MAKRPSPIVEPTSPPVQGERWVPRSGARGGFSVLQAEENGDLTVDVDRRLVSKETGKMKIDTRRRVVKAEDVKAFTLAYKRGKSD